MITDDPLLDKDATSARQVYSHRAAKNIARTGTVLAAFGLAFEHRRQALAMVTQSAGGLAEGIVILMDNRNWYAASALLRQFIETEYLVWLFGDDPAECSAWLTDHGEQARARFRPAKLRRRAAGKFADEEYWTHCEVGGHPHPRGSGLLPERFVAQPLEGQRLEALLWLETAVHLQRFWVALEWTLDALALKQIVVVNEAKASMAIAVGDWFGRDSAGSAAVTGLTQAAAVLSPLARRST